MTLPVSKPHCSKHLSHHEMGPGTNPTWDDHDKTFQMHEDVDDKIIHKSLHVQNKNKQKKCIAFVCTLESACPSEKQGLWLDYTITSHTTHEVSQQQLAHRFWFFRLHALFGNPRWGLLVPLSTTGCFLHVETGEIHHKVFSSFLYNRNYCSINLV